MRAGIVAGAVAIMVVGVVMASTMGSYSTVTNSSGSVTLIPFVGIGLIIIGFILFIAGLAASNERPYMMVARAQGQEPSGYHCMRCGAGLILGYNKCPSCNKKVRWKKVLKLQQPVKTSAPISPESPLPTEKQRPIRMCIKCGFQLDDDSKFCKHCGNQIP